jgi:hypothetical protein
MKRTLILVIAVSLIIAGVAMATVVSTKHDMRNLGTIAGRTISAGFGAATATSQVCVFCHHPHRGSSSLAGSVLLWNINDSNKTYTTYSSPTTNASGIGGDVDANADASKYTLLCMGCHDGAAAANTFIRPAVDGTLGTVPAFGDVASNLSSTLQDDHPVDFTYPTVANADGLTDIRLNNGGVVDGTPSTVEYPLYEGTMQCATCHDVHNGGSPLVQFMRGGTTNIIASSAICIDCHTAK